MIASRYPYGAHHPALEEAGRDPAGPVPHDLELAVQDPCAALERQRFDPRPRHPWAVLARPSPAAAPRRTGDLVKRQVPAYPADHGMTVGDRGLDQPGAHEPGVEQDPYPAEPVAEQAQQEAPTRELAAIGAAPDQAQHQRHRPDPPPVLDDRGQAQPALAAQEPRPVRLGGVVAVQERPGGPGRDALDHGVVDDDVPDRRGEQLLQHPEQRLPDRQPGPAAAFQQPVVGGPAARQPDREDGVGDVSAPGDGGPEQQLGEGGAGSAGHRYGDAADEGGQDGRDGDAGHRLQPTRWRIVTLNRCDRETSSCPPTRPFSNASAAARSPGAGACWCASAPTATAWSPGAPAYRWCACG